MSERHWTARDFLRAASEFELMTPNNSEWHEKLLAKNPPRLVRLQRLRAFAKAFDVQPGFEALWSGGFIKKRSFERYAPVCQRILSDCETRFPGMLSTGKKPLIPIELIYKRLFSFLMRHAYPMLDVNSDIYEASGMAFYPLSLVELAIAGVPDAIRPIEELVGLIIEPDGRSFTARELARHGWPSEDLDRLDAEWA